MKLIYLRQVFFTRSGIGFRSFRLIKESVHQYKGKQFHFWSYAALNFLFRKSIPLKGRFVLIHNHWCPGYFHWITEALPRLYAASHRVDGRTLILPSDFLNLEPSVRLLFSGEIYWVPPKKNLSIEDLLLPENPSVSGDYDKGILHSIRNLAWKKYAPKPNLNYLYISRSFAKSRKVYNEKEVLNELESIGAELAYFENESFENQVSLCRSTQVLISIHGAALANIVFMKPNSRVIELQRAPSESNQADKLYRDLASVMDVSYEVIFSSPSSPYENLKYGDIVVSLPELLQLIKNK